ncbi:hypothetical protein WAF17_22340 (plasmid) [Bernardetia sp. ABR2-2B]|uniref:immunoglobulin domain-containing protein n=1 Tax=Bernardetia sp. ABR2-2B TaxID=3127472 RepID=UPI0030D1118E
MHLVKVLQMRGFCFLYTFCFLLLLPYSSDAQKGGGASSEGCSLTWYSTGLQENDSYFTGSGSASTLIPNFNAVNGQAINGWVNYVIETRIESAFFIPPKNYTMRLQLGTTPYEIRYRLPRDVYLGLLEIVVSNSSVYSAPVTSTADIAVFRIAREGNIMRFYKNNELIPVPTLVTADTGADARVEVSASHQGKMRVNVYSPMCQQLIPDFEVTSLECDTGIGTVNMIGKWESASHYSHNTTLNSPTGTPQGSSLSSSVPSVGWITSVIPDYRAATYYMGIGKTITWQHTFTQLNGNTLVANNEGFARPTNILAVQEDGWIGFRNDNKTRWSVGFIDAATSTVLYEYRAKSLTFGEIPIGGIGTGVDIYIEGNKVATVSAFLSDYLRIAKEGATIKFYVNEVEVYSESITTPSNLKANFGFGGASSSISYPTLSFCTPPVEITLTTTDVSACQGQDILPLTPTTQYTTELRWYATNPDGVFPRPLPIDVGFSFDPDASGLLSTGVHSYYVTGIDLNGQESTARQITITVHNTPQATLTPIPVVCQGESVTLQITNYSPSYSYSWEIEQGGIWTSVGVGEVATLDYINGTTSLYFRLVTTNYITSCSSYILRTISYTSSPTLVYNSFVEAEVGETATFDVINTSGIIYTYQWRGPNGYISSVENPSILVNSGSYGEYVVVVSNNGCEREYRAILSEKGVFATLKENLGASYYHTNKVGKLYFKFDEKYGVGDNGTAAISVFNYDFQEVTQLDATKEYGYNWYELDLSSFGIEGDQYVLHIRDELARRYVLRVKYVTDNSSVYISENEELCISEASDRRSVRLNATTYVDASPYSISWYVSKNQNTINQLENLSDSDREALLFSEETEVDSRHTATYFETQQYYLNVPNQDTLYASGEGIYHVRALVRNYCGEQTYSNIVTINVYIGENCRVVQVVPKKKHRFEFFFSIRRLLSPRPNTNPTTQ